MGRIEFLQQRKREIDARLAAEQMKRRRREDKENARLFRIVGAALVDHAAQNADGFGLMLRQVLGNTVTDSKAVALLRRKGML
ncbi:MAG: hypothetical protein ACRD3O_00020 [Terriglobia bacterium]